MRVGVYIDGYNLYYGGRKLCGRGTPGWRWLDLRSLASDLMARHGHWSSSTISRITYCTARINAGSNPSGFRDQDIYQKALAASGSVDLIEYGTYVERVKRSPLAVADAKGRPILTKSGWPVNPGNAQTAGDLRGRPADGCGGHWWLRLTADDYRKHQLPDPCGQYRKPHGW